MNGDRSGCPGGRGTSGQRGRAKRVTMYRVVPGETVVADRSAVLEMSVSGSAVMVVYDRSRQMASAAHFLLPDPKAGAGNDAVPLRLLSQLVERGSDPESLEIYAVGPGLPAVLGVESEEDLPGRIPARVALDCGASNVRGPRRVEFDVAMGRIVVERDAWT